MSIKDFIKRYKEHNLNRQKREAKAKIKSATEGYKELSGIKSEEKKVSFFEKFKDKDYLIETTQDWFETIVFVLVVIIFIRAFIGELRWIPSGSMIPTLIEKDKVFVEKVVSFFRPIQRGDILVFYPPEPEPQRLKGFWAGFARLTGVFCKDIAYIKRVIALPGEKFEIKQNKKGESFVYINDELLDEPYIIGKENWPKCEPGLYCGPFIVPKDTYFMMGDNRGNSKDSRYWGFLPKENVIGRAVMLFRAKRIGQDNDVNYYNSELNDLKKPY